MSKYLPLIIGLEGTILNDNETKFLSDYKPWGVILFQRNCINHKDTLTLIDKIKSENISELIFALSATMEGDTTNFYIFKQIQDLELKVTTIARGVSVGNELEYTDEVTLGRSIIKRIPFESSIKN